ncbi:hypothetical protein, partial [Rhodoplanes sp. SY1]|uniref:hypothetical protein n=1 Tax=Rhodoplanes sp. SY1 TaxID=3166646 RepID=UPI0038B4FED3
MPDSITRCTFVFVCLFCAAAAYAGPAAGQIFQPPSRPPGWEVDQGGKGRPPSGETISFKSDKYTRSLNVQPALLSTRMWGDVIVNDPNIKDGPNGAAYEIRVFQPGSYLLRIRYAAAQSRPIEISLNKSVLSKSALSEPTGCWEFRCQSWVDVATVQLAAGTNDLQFYRSQAFPHISE